MMIAPHPNVMINLPDLATAAVCEPLIMLAYGVFGVLGFGASLVGAPLLAHALPVATIVTVMAALDLIAAWSQGWRMSAQVSRAELRAIIPALLLGSFIGAWLLLTLPVHIITPVLGLFALLYGIRSLRTPKTQKTWKAIDSRWAWLFGTVGGIFSALFGVGGWVFAAYLSRRLDDVQAIRATQTAVLMTSSVVRVILFLISGQLLQADILGWVLCLIPAMALGVYLGHRIGRKLDRPKFLKVLHLVLIVTGASLLLRAWI